MVNKEATQALPNPSAASIPSASSASDAVALQAPSNQPAANSVTLKNKQQNMPPATANAVPSGSTQPAQQPKGNIPAVTAPNAVFTALGEDSSVCHVPSG